MQANKLLYIEFLRVVCIVAVIANHIPLAAVNTFAATASVADSVFCHACSWMNHFAVPIFVMITGTLLLDSRKEISLWKALSKYAWRIVVMLLTVGYGFALLEQYANEHIISLSLFGNALYNVLAGKGWDHMWYLYMLIGIYLLIPFLKPAINTLPLRSIGGLIAIIFLFSSINPVLNALWGYSIPIRFPILSIYVLYLLAGWYIAHLKHSSVPEYAPWIAIVIALGAVVVLGACSYCKYAMALDKAAIWSDYSSPLVVLLSAVIFYICYIWQDKFHWVADSKTMSILAKDSFGIYLFHMLYVNILYKVIHFNPLEYGYWSFVIILVVVLILSLVTTELFRKIPVIGKYI